MRLLLRRAKVEIMIRGGAKARLAHLGAVEVNVRVMGRRCFGS